jgi:hypothetical protein
MEFGQVDLAGPVIRQKELARELGLLWTQFGTQTRRARSRGPAPSFPAAVNLVCFGGGAANEDSAGTADANDPTAPNHPEADQRSHRLLCIFSAAGLTDLADRRPTSAQDQAWACPALERSKVQEPAFGQKNERCNFCRQKSVRSPDNWRQERNRQSNMAQAPRQSTYTHVALRQGYRIRTRRLPDARFAAFVLI